MYRNFDFAIGFAPSVVVDLHLSEEYLYFFKDAHGCILKIGAAFEDLMVHHVSIKEDISFPFQPTLCDYINLFERKEICPKKIILAMKYLRHKRNLANHEGWSREYDAEVCLVKMHNILAWSVIKYGLGVPTKYKTVNGILEQDTDFRGIFESFLIPRI